MIADAYRCGAARQMLGGTEDDVLIAVLDHLERAAMYTNRKKHVGALVPDRRPPRLREPRRFLNPGERVSTAEGRGSIGSAPSKRLDGEGQLGC